MPTYIKTGYWDTKAKAPDGWLDLNLFCATHGGGGSQNLDQVLAVGNTSQNSINLQSVATNLINTQYRETGIQCVDVFSNPSFPVYSYFESTPNRLLQIRCAINTSQPSELKYTSNPSGNHNFFIQKFNSGNFRRFEVNASYTDGNFVELRDESTTGDLVLAQLNANIANGNSYIYLQSTIGADIKQGIYRDNEIYFTDSVLGTTSIFPSYDIGGTQVFTPEFNGKIANVNERIIDNNVDLSAGNYDCATYGVYVVNVGDGSNTFDLSTFVSNGVDGQFVTICANDLPINCTNTAGIIIGNANISSNGLYKLMKIGNDIYSSNI